MEIRDNKPGERWHREGESLEHYIERQFISLHERLDNMESVESGFASDISSLAQVIPQLSGDITALHTTVTEKEGELTAAIAAKTEDDAEKATLESELKAIQGLKPELDNILQQAQTAAQTASTTPTAGTPAGTPPAGSGTPPAAGDGTAAAPTEASGTTTAASPGGASSTTDEKPKYTFHGSDTSTIDTVVWIKTNKTVEATGEALFEFANDVAGEPAKGAEAGVWEVYEGPTAETAVQGSSGQEGAAQGV